MSTIDRIGGTQYGIITRRQLVECGVSIHTVKRWLTKGRLELAHPRVYRMVGAPVTWEQRVLAGVLAGGEGVVASHRAAARLWGLLDDDVIEITVPEPRFVRLAGVRVHRSQELGRRWVSRRGPIPVTNPMRVLVDIGCVVPGAVVADMVERALTARLVTVPGLEAAYETLGSGRRGAAVLGDVLRHRALGAARPDGLLEPRMANLLRDQGLPPAAFQHEISSHRGRFVARVDFAYPDRLLAIEVDGHEVHATPQALQSDLNRQNALVSLGWTVLRFTWSDVERQPRKVAGAVRRMLDRRPA